LEAGNFFLKWGIIVSDRTLNHGMTLMSFRLPIYRTIRRIAVEGW